MGPEPEGDDDWTKYADTGYESSYDPWADMVAAEETEEDDFVEDCNRRFENSPQFVRHVSDSD